MSGNGISTISQSDDLGTYELPMIYDLSCNLVFIF